MCGLIGVVTVERPGPASAGREGSPEALLEAAQRLEVGAIGDLEMRLEPLEQQVQERFGFASFYASLNAPGHEQVLRNLVVRLEGLADGCDAQQLSASGVETRERWSALAVRARDLAWRIGHDLLPNLDKVHRLAGTQGRIGRVKAFELWKLNSQLNGIDRLEVRGRDSAGMAIPVYFTRPGLLAAFLARPGMAALVRPREGLPDFVDGAIRQYPARDAGWDCLLFAYKVAQEIGEMGENVAGLRTRIASDEVLQAALELDGVLASPFAHTRWASNGVISEPNCHPLENSYLMLETGQPASSGHAIVAALNGDIDNYQSLKERLEQELGRTIAPNVTTDAKIIPLWIERNLERGLSFEEAFRATVAEFHGSMAIAVQTSLEPGKIFLAQRGSGQSIYIGQTSGGYLFASELYGLVEETRTFIKMDGEKERIPGDPSTAGQLAVLDAGWMNGCRVGLQLSYYDGTPVPDLQKLVRTAEITTRDINRAGYPHFMLKEITESVGSVRKTLRGRFRLENGTAHFTFADEVFGGGLRERLREGRIRRIFCIGQGTAAIAGSGIAALMTQFLADQGLEVRAVKATELSGFMLRPRMDDTLVVAVSQSGTTTDTNRTVDMVRERGARVVAIVNRRNSDLVYKANAVLYTSDGRDVEMSVASTKAFYAQVCAGFLLTLALAQALGTLSEAALHEELATLEQLPLLIGRILNDHAQIQALAERFAVRHRYWAVVGNGANRVSADEIRIKLSELCYKAIACDYTEDKKHIDLSSEPLILVCAAGLSSSNTSDVVKEVAIFKAHKACPIVITQEGESRFDPYAAAVISVPRGGGRLSFVLTTVAGHLWGYYAARALDGQAQSLRKLRARSVSLYERQRSRPGGTAAEVLTAAVRAELSTEIRQIETALGSGSLDSGLPARSAVRLSLMLNVISGRLAFDDVVGELGPGASSSAGLFEHYLAALTGAINDLTRPIDAIKHQAKTVTVGISRLAMPEGVIFEALESLEHAIASILPSHLETLQALSPLVERVVGSVEYALEDLNAAGDPTDETLIRVIQKTGIVAQTRSRADQGAPLIGSKWLITLERRMFVGEGSSDGRKLVMFPLVQEGRPTGILLLHVSFREQVGLEERLNAVKHYRNRYERLVGLVTENNLSWNDAHLLHIPVAQLFEGSRDEILQALRSVRRSLAS